MAVTITAADFGNHVDTLIGRGVASTIDRVVCDFPSFLGRFKGMMDESRMQQLVNKLGKLILLLPDHATVTISCTGEAQRLIKQWFAFNGLDWEIAPGSAFAAYAPHARDKRTNDHFITRTDQYTWCATWKKVSNTDWSMNNVAMPTAQEAPSVFNDYPFPTMQQTAIHSYRVPVHVAFGEAREDLIWEQMRFATEPDRLAFVQYMNGMLVRMDGSDDWMHFPSGVWPVHGVTSNQAAACRNIADYPNISTHISNSKIFHLCNWLIQTFTNAGENVYMPFDGSGTLTAAAVVSGRSGIVCELNAGRADLARAIRDELTSVTY